MENPNRGILEQVTWQQMRESVVKVNPDFAKVIDELNPGDELRLYRATYPFGSEISRAGTTMLPAMNGEVVPITDSKISDQVRNDLNYTGTVPFGLVLNGAVEALIKQKDSILPLNIVGTGKFFGLWRALDLSHSSSYHAYDIFNVIAGTHSIFTLPKITDQACYKKLCRARGIRLPLPSNLLDQAALFTLLSRHKDFPSPWQAEILYFSGEWFKKIKDSKFISFHHFLLLMAWSMSDFFRNKYIFDGLWSFLVAELIKQNVKVKPHVADIVKYLVMVALGVMPGLAPAVNDEVAPVSGFQHDLLKIYELKYFAPTLMVPQYFDFDNENCSPVYWSLQLPAYFESVPKQKTPNSILNDLLEIKHVVDLFRGLVIEGKLKGLVGTPLQEKIRQINFDYFHSDTDIDEHVRSFELIAKEDPNLIKCSINGNKDLSPASPFLRGCIRLSKVVA